MFAYGQKYQKSFKITNKTYLMGSKGNWEALILRKYRTSKVDLKEKRGSLNHMEKNYYDFLVLFLPHFISLARFSLISYVPQ